MKCNNVITQDLYVVKTYFIEHIKYSDLWHKKIPLMAINNTDRNQPGLQQYHSSWPESTADSEN